MFRLALILILLILTLPYFSIPEASITRAEDTSLPVITAANMDLVQRYAVLGQGGGMHAKFAWSPDGKTLAVVALGGVWIYDLDNLEKPRLLINSAKIETEPMWGFSYH